MKITFAAACAAVVLGAAIASCGSTGNVATGGTTSASPTPVASAACTPPPNTQVQVVYPQPQATGVLVAPGTIVIAVAPQPLPSTSYLYVNVSDTTSGSSIGTAFAPALGVITSAQVPQPQLNPPFSLPIYESTSFGGTFGANDTFKIFLANSSCYPGVDLKSSFST